MAVIVFEIILNAMSLFNHSNIKIPENIFIPDTYINDIDIKISLYKRIALISNNAEKEGLISEIRFFLSS